MTSETGLAIPDGSAPDMALRLEDIKHRLTVVQEFFQAVMKDGEDFGVIDGTQKPTLLKPGAEKLCELYGYAICPPEVDETVDQESGFYRARVTISLVRRDGSLVAAGVGEANTKEGRYRWRSAKRKCPDCGVEAIIKGKAEYGGGWLCFRKQGGCGAKYGDGHAAIESQPQGRIENDDPWTLWNTVLKMAKKRALIDATLSATRSSGLFTQDMDELKEWASVEPVEAVSVEPDEIKPPRPRGGVERPDPRPSARPIGGGTGITQFWKAAKAMGYEAPEVLKVAGGPIAGWTDEQLDGLMAELKDRKGVTA